MEGDAKGQVGGMEMPEKERKRLAGESKAWSCQGCGGRTNDDILKEQAGKVAEGKQTEHFVPEELRIGFGDQMKKQEAENANPGNAGKSDPATAIVATEMPPAITPMIVPTTAAVSAPNLPQPIRTIPTAVPIAPSGQSDGVPPWIDKAITGLAAALALMVVKKILF